MIGQGQRWSQRPSGRSRRSGRRCSFAGMGIIARLPFGMPDPVLSGASAVALYTGGLWPVTALELTVADPGKLVAELFAIGCRWSRGARNGGLWHPDCEIGIDILPEVEPATPAKRANQLRVALDLERSGPSGVATLRRSVSRT
jgi:hypothetical protein